MVSRSTERILAGDQSERLPVTGANDEFDRLSVRMNVMLDKILLLDKGLKNVSDSIAHDLKTPLTRLRNKADAALNSGTDSGDALSEIIADSDQLIKTFNALLMISRVEAGSQVAEFADLDMSETVADVAELYEPVAEEQGFELATEIDPKISVRGNRELLSQAISNLLDNALKYGASEDGANNKVLIGLMATKSEILLTIADNGPGIPADKRQEVKERFVRLDESRSKPGNGLGLSLVEAIARLHGAKLELGDHSPGLVVTLKFQRA
jgi:signal transduction histidine kinase